jgi:hypothetical protein
MAADAICEWLFEKGLVPVGPPAAPPVTALLSAARAAG